MHEDFRDLYVGVDLAIPILGGETRRYVNLDNAASTPAFRWVQQAVDEFLPYYSSVHRGTGFKSQLSTYFYEKARHTVLAFMGANPDEHTCIFGKNTTEALNKLARRFLFTPQRDVVLTTLMEHHSNDLPWRANAHVVHVGVLPDGRLDEAELDALLAHYGSRVALVAVTGASNVTGYLNPIHRLAEKAHAVGAQILVDCAQLAPHRAVNMGSLDDPAHLDYVSISAHKMYAPFGSGALIGRRDTFAQGAPDMVGGGTIDMVTLDEVIWAQPPDRDEAGSPNTVGAVALAAAMRQLQEVGMDVVAQHEAELTAYALERLTNIPGIHIFGDTDPRNTMQRVGVIPFLVENADHFLVSAILGHEFGIGVRSGCFCAHPYVLHLLEASDATTARLRERIIQGDRTEMPGLIRASFGLYNVPQDVDVLVDALQAVVRGAYQGKYQQDRASGTYSPAGWAPVFEQYFDF
ncbi:MAG: aminotransferase class V-fold PLP-dependent enzyme [Anaerolineales bacterium]